MSPKQLLQKYRNWLDRLNGSTLLTDISEYKATLQAIHVLSETYRRYTDKQLKDLSKSLKKRAATEDIDELLPTAFALVYTAFERTMSITPFDVQLIGAMVLHKGKLLEMKTGEGKTFVAAFASYLNALSGKGVHILTFNDYLARRDSEWLSPLYRFLGMQSACIQENMTVAERQAAYSTDITYLTARESGFDYLRDNLCYHPQDRVQRPFHYVIVDEADSILIDEARIPLVLAGSVDSGLPDMVKLGQLARQLNEYRDFEFDEYSHTINLTETGIKTAEQFLQCDNLYKSVNLETLTRLNCALYAEYLVQRDVDYIVRDGIVELVDEFTGRVAEQRRWPDGLQAAIEAKEHVNIRERGQILNSIPMQQLINLYPKISGMTATAAASEVEFREMYNQHIVVVPPNKTCVRKDQADLIYPGLEEKQKALISEIIKVNNTGRPILVGTHHVRESEQLAAELKQCGIKCQVLNARNDEREASIVANAGKPGAVTISTNMAGRGTDIRLGGIDEEEKQQVLNMGGLYVIGTNRYESTRIDDQLRGRAGRQGGPGESRFFISLEDDLYKKYRLKDLVPKSIYKKSTKGHIDNPIINRELDRIQRIIDGQNFEIKKDLLKYTSLIEKQRHIHFNSRNEYLDTDKALQQLEDTAPDTARLCLKKHDRQVVSAICRKTALLLMDKAWSDYLAELADFQEGVYLNRLGGKIPVVEFLKFAIDRFDTLGYEMEENILESLGQIKPDTLEPDTNIGIKAPSSTWTYQVNDNPFENMIGLQGIGNSAMAFAIALMWPMVIGAELLKKITIKTRENR